MMKKVNTFDFDKNIEYFTLENGLKVYLLENNLINKCYVSMKVKYGSIDQEFIHNGKTMKTPEGIAHFLEHKLFEMEDKKDAAVILSELSADPNAYTTNTLTSYLFSTTSEVGKCLKILLSFVLKSNFNQKSIKKEIKIIEQELNMYDDEPDVVLVKKIFENMYFKNHVRTDIGGTLKSIQKINKELLDLCYNVFYNPNNLVLFVSGNFNREEVLNVIKKYEKRENITDILKVERIYYKENSKVRKDYEEVVLNTTIPKVCIGIKFDADVQYSLKEIVGIKVLNSILLSQSSDNFEYLLKSNLVTENFASYVTYEESFFHMLIEADSKKPDLFIKKIKKILFNIDDVKIDEEEFARVKNGFLGSFVFSLNNIENLVNSFLKYENIDINLFEFYDCIKNLTLEDVLNCKKMIKKDNIAIIKALPKKA